MSSIGRKTIETPAGTGKVYKSGRYIATVQYRLNVTQDILRSRTFGASSESEGLQTITGTVTLVKDGPVEFGEVLTLQLSDGRKIDFFTKRDNLSGTYPISINRAFY